MTYANHPMNGFNEYYDSKPEGAWSQDSTLSGVGKNACNAMLFQSF